MKPSRRLRCWRRSRSCSASPTLTGDSVPSARAPPRPASAQIGRGVVAALAATSVRVYPMWALEASQRRERALATALSLDGAEEREPGVADPRADPAMLVLLRGQLRHVQRSALQLSADQRLVLAHQLADTGCREFCRQFGWSPEKYRKVAQRGRARLRALASLED